MVCSVRCYRQPGARISCIDSVTIRVNDGSNLILKFQHRLGYVAAKARDVVKLDEITYKATVRNVGNGDDIGAINGSKGVG